MLCQEALNTWVNSLSVAPSRAPGSFQALCMTGRVQVGLHCLKGPHSTMQMSAPSSLESQLRGREFPPQVRAGSRQQSRAKSQSFTHPDSFFKITATYTGPKIYHPSHF
jgi:hypothetical protein